MLYQRPLLGFVALVGMAISACDRDKPSTNAAAPVTAPPADPTPSAPPPPPAVPPKVDTVDLEALKGGLAAMQPRILAQTDAFAKIEPKEHFRFFMHPSDDKNASIEFNTKGLSSLSLSPYMEDFSGNADCIGTPEAGVARLSWSIDSGKKTSLMIDRNYAGVLNIDVAKTSKLKLEVDKGNDVTYCDWLSVGFLNVK